MDTRNQMFQSSPSNHQRWWIILIAIGIIIVSVLGVIVYSQRHGGSLLSFAQNHDIGLITDSSFPSRSPMTFPGGTSDEAILTEYESHLQKLNKTSPETIVLAYIFFKSPAPEDQIARLMQDYGLSGGDHASVQLRFDTDSTMALPFPESASSMALLRDYLQPWIVATPDPNTDFRLMRSMPSQLSFTSLSAYARIDHLAALWNDHRDLIRGIGVMGKVGQVRTNWNTIRPEDPIRP